MNIYSAISANKYKTWLIMILFVVFITTLVYVFSKAMGLDALGLVGMAFIMSGLMSVGSYYFSDKLVLATTGAKEINKADYPEYYRVVENLSIASGLPMPKVYVINDPSPNAMATGRDPNHAVVCATIGLLSLMNKTELEGVIAHELSHVKNYDIRLMGVVAILVGFIAIISDIFLRLTFFRDDDNRGSGIFLVIALILAILSPIAATLIQLAVSRKREYLADASGALLTRYPDGLASALEKLLKDRTSPRTASNATAHLFIENPFENRKVKNFFTGLFNTHPPLEDRIRVLRSM